MAQLLIRKLEESIVNGLKVKAELHGHSLEQEARDTLASGAKLLPSERKAFFERFRKMGRWIEGTDSTQMIREDRDSC